MRFVPIEFEPDKDDVNRAKHGLALADALRFDWTGAVTRVDQRFDYGEPRFRSYAMLDGVLHMVAWTPRGEVLRVISLRKASRLEARRYAKP